MVVNKNLLKKLILGTSVFAFSMILSIGDSKAVIQSNGDTNAVYNVGTWLTKIRQMEIAGGAMGLSETLNSNLTASSDSNNIDVHMQKNTEYGALAILSASCFGNPNKIESGQTTTGNVTGVVMNINKEWVAAFSNNTTISPANVVAVKYKNSYTAPTYTEKIGDGVQGVVGWHGSGASTWISSWSNSDLGKSGLVRSYKGSIFSYYGYGYDNSYRDQPTRWKDGSYAKSWSSRAVIVLGEGV